MSANETRPLYWSVRRELWEHRSVVVAPLVVAAVLLFGFLASLAALPERMRMLSKLDPAGQRMLVTMPQNTVAGLIVVAASIVAFFYCLEALNGERRDRSILFWKSLPVSDRTAVIAKALVPLAVLPAIAFVLAAAAQLVILAASGAVLAATRADAALWWSHVKFFQSALALLYGIVALTAWNAPVYAWLLLISAWARRAAFLWAVLPPLLLAVLVRLALGGEAAASLMRARTIGWFERAFAISTGGGPAVDPLSQLTPLKFLSTPGLWIGLVLAFALLTAAMRIRRRREPI